MESTQGRADYESSQMRGRQCGECGLRDNREEDQAAQPSCQGKQHEEAEKGHAVILNEMNEVVMG